MMRKAVFFLEGILATLHPWFAVFVLVGNWILKPSVKYYSQRETSVLFLAGMPFGFLLGYGVFGWRYYRLWLDCRGDLLTIMAGSRPIWLLAVLGGLAIWGILRSSKNERGEGLPNDPVS